MNRDAACVWSSSKFSSVLFIVLVVEAYRDETDGDHQVKVDFRRGGFSINKVGFEVDHLFESEREQSRNANEHLNIASRCLEEKYPLIWCAHSPFSVLIAPGQDHPGQ